MTLLRTLLLASCFLNLGAFAVRADEAPKSGCHTLADVQAANDKDSKWVHLTPDQLKAAHLAWDIPPEAVDMWGDLPPGYETWTLFGFTDKGCMQGKGGVSDADFTALTGNPT